MRVNVLDLTYICKVLQNSMYMFFFCYFFSLLFLKLLKLCLLALICFNIQLCGVFWASVNSTETDKYLLYDICWILVFTCWNAFVAEVTAAYMCLGCSYLHSIFKLFRKIAKSDY